MIRRTGAIFVLAVLYLCAAQLGNNFKQTLTIFSIVVWVIAAAMFIYLILFRGMKLDLFGKTEASVSTLAASETGISGEVVESDAAIVEHPSVARRSPAAE